MIKDLIKYIVLSGLLFGGHYFLSEMLPGKGLGNYREEVHLMLFTLFIVSHVLSKIISKKSSVLPGQIFLGFSVVKLISAGLFIFIIKQLSEVDISKAYILVFMASYFIYLGLDVLLMLKALNKPNND